jgi:hypothetical protein
LINRRLTNFRFRVRKTIFSENINYLILEILG